MLHRRSSRRGLATFAAAGLLLFLLSGCSFGGFDAGSSAPYVGTSSEAALDGAVAGAEGAAGVAGLERSVITTSHLSIEVDDPDAAADEAVEVVRSMGGSVESLTVHQLGEGTRADVTLRVPSERLDEALDALEQVGTVQSESRSSVDVTMEHTDLEARVGALEDAVERLRGLMADASTTSELLEAEAVLTERQQQLDGLRAQLEVLEGQVDLATVSLALSSKSALPGGGPANFWEGLLAGVGSLGVFAAGALVVLGVLLPWALLIGVLVLVVVGIVRWARRRRRSRPSAPSIHAPNAVPSSHPAPDPIEHPTENPERGPLP